MSVHAENIIKQINTFRKWLDDYEFTENNRERIKKILTCLAVCESSANIIIENELVGSLDPELNRLFSPIFEAIQQIYNTFPNASKGKPIERTQPFDNALNIIYKYYAKESLNPGTQAGRFHSLINTIAAFAIHNGLDFQKSVNTLEKNILEIKALKTSVEALQGRIIAKNYAEIFKEQAINQSGITFQMKMPFFKIGYAQRWLFLGTFIVILGGFLFYNVFTYGDVSSQVQHQIASKPEKEKIHLKANKLSSDKSSLNDVINKHFVFYSNRIIAILIWFFAFRFCFRQYSINMNLHTANKHRENVLRSYDKLLEAVGADSDAKNTLIMEVARAIYQTTTTGYVSSQESQPAPSILEITKVLGQTKAGG